ncbi:MAG: ADYC domain-containing protein [Nostoc sp. DedQUE11]|nr:ADYC domain-containing protein [Nostoc sp. DedQUE11]
MFHHQTTKKLWTFQQNVHNFLYLSSFIYKIKKIVLSVFVITLTILLVSCASGDESVIIRGKDLKNAQLTGLDEQGRTLNFQIKDVELDPKDPEKETYLYTVFYLDKSDSRWKNVCKPDIENVAKAIPLSGSWDRTGAYIESNNLVTFGCTSGSLGKCVRFGYKPWKSVQGKSLRDFHQACTRMVRADYCGNGQAHTQEGVSIDVYDVLGIQKQTPKSGMVFEAAWQPDGATYINHPRLLNNLSEIRKECPKKLTGRINENANLSTAKKVQQKWSSALLFNDSLLREPIR